MHLLIFILFLISPLCFGLSHLRNQTCFISDEGTLVYEPGTVFYHQLVNDGSLDDSLVQVFHLDPMKDEKIFNRIRLMNGAPEKILRKSQLIALPHYFVVNNYNNNQVYILSNCEVVPVEFAAGDPAF
jgi:hypothetical protein